MTDPAYRAPANATDGEIHHEYVLLQLAADRADDDVMDTIHNDQSRNRHRNIARMQRARAACEHARDQYYHANRVEIQRHLDLYNV